MDIDGKIATPSTFNINRDSLANQREKLHQIFLSNLPDFKLLEINHKEKKNSNIEESDEDEDVVPLEFRTATIDEKGEKLVIQARPMNFADLEEDLAKAEQEIVNDDLYAEERNKSLGGSQVDAYLRMMRNEPFNMEDENVVLIDPGLDTKEKYKDFLLPCEREDRINNCLQAPVRIRSHSVNNLSHNQNQIDQKSLNKT